MTTARSEIDQHPDLLALRANYDRVAETAPVQVSLGLTMLAGLYAAMSPWIVGFNGTSRLATIDLIAGLAVAVLALSFSSVLDRTHGVVWTLPLLGIGLIIAPWVHTGASPTASMMWSNVVIGAVVTVLGLVATGLGMRARTGAPRMMPEAHRR
ncbi:SPW repeat protein [Mycolicibacterium chubuense]|uniref:SPW repeat protein n=1 Tax=Mycolicibacterium chubuense TaxID=1800 RepID=UPI0003180247|nr:SPW repeat protein [Mycolicibacterium chubuense]